MSRKKLPLSEIFPGLPSRIKEVRKRLGLNQEKFGKLLGVTKVSVCRYELGRVPDAETLKRIAEFGGITVDKLLRGDQAAQLREFAPETYDTRPAVLNLDHLQRALFLTRQFLRQARLKFSNRQEVELASYLYEHLESELADPGEVVIRRLADLIQQKPGEP